MVLLSPRVFSLFPKRTEEEERYFEVTPSQRWTMSFLYFDSSPFALGMHLAHNELADRGFVIHSSYATGRLIIIRSLPYSA
jgi:hypothetical protein